MFNYKDHYIPHHYKHKNFNNVEVVSFVVDDHKGAFVVLKDPWGELHEFTYDKESIEDASLLGRTFWHYVEHEIGRLGISNSEIAKQYATLQVKERRLKLDSSEVISIVRSQFRNNSRENYRIFS